VSDKHELTLNDFDQYDLWSWDDDGDDGSFLPVNDIPRCSNGEIDLGVLYIRSRCTSPDGREWDAILGLLPDDLSVYWISVFDGTLSFEWNLGLTLDATDSISFAAIFRPADGAFPLAVDFAVPILQASGSASIPAPAVA